MAISDREVVTELTEDGAKVEDHFLIGDDIYVANNRGELCILLVDGLPGEEEGEMYDAIMQFLRRNGARIYESEKDYRNQQSDK